MKKIYVKRDGKMYLVTIPFFDDSVADGGAGDDGGTAQTDPLNIGPIVGWSTIAQSWNTIATAWNVT